MTRDLLKKIAEYKEVLHSQTNQDEIIFDAGEEIQVGDNLVIYGTYLSGKNWFVKLYASVADCHMDMSMDCLSDIILGRILNILMKRL